MVSPFKKRSKERSLPKHIQVNDQPLGSVLFFSPNLGTGAAGEEIGPTEDQKFIRSLMGVIPGKDQGRNWLTHVAIVCGIKPNKDTKKSEAYISHATEKGDEKAHLQKIKSGELKPNQVDPDYTLGYVKETLQEQVERDKDRAFISFSPNGESLLKKIEDFFGKDFVEQHELTPEKVEKAFAEHIANAADSEKNKDLNNIKWTMSAGAKVFFHTSGLNHDRMVDIGKQRSQDNSTICSEFGGRGLKIGAMNYFAELYQTALIDARSGKISKENFPKNGFNPNIKFDDAKVKASQIPGYIHVKSNSTPKTLYNDLYKNDDYKMSCYLGNNPVERLGKCLNSMLDSQATGLSEKEKIALGHAKMGLLSRLEEAKQIERLNPNSNKTEICVSIMSKVLPEIQKINKKTHQKAIEIGEGIGIDRKDIRQYERNLKRG